MNNPLDAGTNSNKCRDPKQRHVESISHYVGEAVFDRNKAPQPSKNDKKAATTIQSCISYSKQPPNN